MMHSPLFRIIGAILVTMAVLVFLFRGTFGTPSTVTIHSTLPPAQQKAP